MKKNMLLRKIKSLFKGNNVELIDMDMSKIGVIGRFRAKRQHEFDDLIGKIALSIFHSPFDFRVYQQDRKDLNILIRIYEPGENDFEEQMERYEKGVDLDETE